ncbi:uncharacterized protein LOC125537284 isoform X2 [Triticum urartu]|uniref:uncharacterized protein LOC125537284 isoform X2 n=1 Tax=Triticum urartu TaxID=4572 RepID=UPI002042DA02|nr:uncharacterized protein LOC125537284 isoform X2 [Triticum urartu]
MSSSCAGRKSPCPDGSARCALFQAAEKKTAAPEEPMQKLDAEDEVSSGGKAEASSPPVEEKDAKMLFWIWQGAVYCSSSCCLYSMLACEQDASTYLRGSSRQKKIQSKFCSAVASSTNNKSAQQPDRDMRRQLYCW